jgi:hypothetical protein
LETAFIVTADASPADTVRNAPAIYAAGTANAPAYVAYVEQPRNTRWASNTFPDELPLSISNRMPDNRTNNRTDRELSNNKSDNSDEPAVK